MPDARRARSALGLVLRFQLRPEAHRRARRTRHQKQHEDDGARARGFVADVRDPVCGSILLSLVLDLPDERGKNTSKGRRTDKAVGLVRDQHRSVG